MNGGQDGDGGHWLLNILINYRRFNTTYPGTWRYVILGVVLVLRQCWVSLDACTWVLLPHWHCHWHLHWLGTHGDLGLGLLILLAVRFDIIPMPGMSKKNIFGIILCFEKQSKSVAILKLHCCFSLVKMLLSEGVVLCLQREQSCVKQSYHGSTNFFFLLCFGWFHQLLCDQQ